MAEHKIVILASASPRRRDLLRQAGIRFRMVRSNVDEDKKVPSGVRPATFAVRLAEEKASDVAKRNRGAVVLGADTVVVAEGRILGKPRNMRDARKMLKLLSGRWHEVLTGVAVAKGDRVVSGTERTRVKFMRLTEKVIEDYIATGESMDKAGAYAIQGWAKAFVENIKGDYTNVVGLPLNRVLSMLSEIQAGMDKRRMHDGLTKPLKGGYSDGAL